MYRIPDLTEIAAGAIAYLTFIIPWFECAQYAQVGWWAIDRHRIVN